MTPHQIKLNQKRSERIIKKAGEEAIRDLEQGVSKDRAYDLFATKLHLAAQEGTKHIPKKNNYFA